ncbi:MAG TPA: lysophospholipid acyltransferase family protein [Polyangiaceae bacterium]|nr:lysophospholipid acyltransferase family protein [Polyangiaceae bacterium]
MLTVDVAQPMERHVRPASPLLGIYTYAEFFSLAVGFLPLMVAAAVRHRHDVSKRIPGRWMRRFGKLSSRLAPTWTFSWDGEPPSDVLRKPYVVISNHESTADPFLLSHLPWDMRWIAKEEIFKLPLLGWMMHACGDIPVRRGDRESVARMMSACEDTLRAGLPIMMFPEGTRSKTGELLPFRDGAFELAIRAQVPVLPLALAGTRNCRPKGSLWFGRARSHVRVLTPIATQGMTLEDLPRLRDSARDIIGSAVTELRSELSI